MKIKRLEFLSVSLILVSVLFLSSSCKHSGIPASEMAPVSFTEVQPIFQNYCGTCHNGSGRQGRLDLTNYAGIINSITPGNASKSKAYQAMISTFQIMPPNIAMPTNKRTLIRLWIEQGANPN
ncbi:MAG TPA: c-type cytochrome domain-containing protein [Prolixibacteraceae bacterium]